MQKKFFFIISLGTLLVITPHAQAMKAGRVAQIATRNRIANKSHCKKPQRTAIFVANVHQTLQNLARNNAHDLLSEHYAQIIGDSVVLFRNTPGFISTLSKFINNVKNNRKHIAKGYWYEIITAHKLTTIECHTILGFNQTIEDPKTKLRREFDIITDCSWIECKNRDWSIIDRLKVSRKQLHKQLLDQKKLVELHNTHNPYGIPVDYQLNSYKPISHNFKKWLNKHNIAYSEDS